jgi:signal transduction histidine kinase
VLVSTSPIIGDDGTFQGALSMATDITERKRMENDLRESETRYRGVFDNVKEGVSLRRFIYDERGEIVDAVLIDANPAALRVYGAKSIDEVRGRLYSETASPEAYNLALGFVKKMRASGKPITGEQHLGSNDKYYMVTAAPLGEDHVITTSFDITERVKMEHALKRSNDELQQFAYVASHDLQEPLRMVTSYMELLDKRFGSELSPKAKEYMAFAVDGAHRMRELIDDLLVYSRVGSGPRAYSSVDLEGTARIALEHLHASIVTSNARINIEPLPTVWGDRTQLTQVLQNLIGNAIKFHGPELPVVRVSAEQSNDVWVIAVKDNGIGISPDNQKKLFQMFMRFNSQEEYPGTGMGLAITKKIVEQHGGKIWVESEPGKGTTFFFTMPIKHED